MPVEDLDEVVRRLASAVESAGGAATDDGSADPAGSSAQGAAAAVAAVLRPGDDTVELLIIERAERRGDPWSGQLAFPGGRREPQDADDRATAERETREELGLDLGAARWLTRLSTVSGRRATGRRLEVAAHVYGLDADAAVELRPNEEVADAFWVPLRHLVTAENAMRYRYAGLPLQRFDAIRVHGQLGERVLWGLTLRFVEDLLERLGERLPRVGG